MHPINVVDNPQTAEKDDENVDHNKLRKLQEFGMDVWHDFTYLGTKMKWKKKGKRFDDEEEMRLVVAGKSSGRQEIEEAKWWNSY